jgi:hypothetical protein
LRLVGYVPRVIVNSRRFFSAFFIALSFGFLKKALNQTYIKTNTSMKKQIISSLLSVVTVISLAHASSVTGTVGITETTATDLTAGQVESDSQAFYLVEQQGVTLGSDLSVGAAGTYDQANQPTFAGSIPAGSVVDSYLLHFDPVGSSGGSQQTVLGSITFDQAVLGVIFSRNAGPNGEIGLNATDDSVNFFGLAGTTYPTGSGLRGIFDDASDGYSFFASGNTLSFAFSGLNNSLDEIRVLVDSTGAVSAIPEPIHYMMMVVSALIAFAIYRSKKNEVQA